jgi:hypothetical protein
MDWGNLASWAAVVVSVIVLIRAIISEKRAKASAVSASQQRQRTVAAAERSAKAVEDVAAAIRDSAGGGTAPPSAIHQGPTWGIEHRSGSVYALVNNTPFPQTEVGVTGAPVRRGGGPYDEIKAFSEIEFFGLSAWGMDQTITVKWTDQNGDRQEWSKPLPPKP